MKNLLSKLTGEQALDVLQRLAARQGDVADAILVEAKRVLAAVDVEEIADEVFNQLDGIAVEDCWDRAGRHRDGYTTPEDAAVQLIEEELQPFVAQIERYHSMGMAKQERDYCMGVILGSYRYEKESKSEFKECMASRCSPMRSLIRKHNRFLLLRAVSRGIPLATAIQNGWRDVPKPFVRAAASGVRWQAVFRATPLFPASQRMQTPRNGVESQHMQ
ncbi:MAG: hypothetical protein FJ222_02485 [Lentisphaerae bacterium]|nr:hypothetical protein [Lentisphaerota bacterium]